LRKTEVKTRYDAVDRFLEDLGEVEDLCQSSGSVGHPEYERFRRFVCSGDVDAVADVPWERTIAFATYYLIFHRRDLKAAEMALGLLKSRDLDGEEEAMLKILELAYAAAADPPCGDPKAASQYAKKVRGLPEPTERVALLKALVLMHLTGRKDAETFKRKIERAFRAGCYPMPFHYFAFHVVDRVEPLCPQEQQSQQEAERREAQKPSLCRRLMGVWRGA
jgi:hypothetical protein